MWLKIILFAIFIAMATRILRCVYFLGPHRVIHKHWPGPCRNVAPIISGSEGIALTSQGLAFISSGLSNPFAKDERIKNAVGKIYLFDFRKPGNDAIELAIKGDVTLGSLHGISMWEDLQGIRIFVVNHHHSEGDAIEILQFRKPDTLEHIKTVRDIAFTSLNDVVATGPDTFYATNDFSVVNGYLRLAQLLFHIRAGNLVYYDGLETSFTGVNGGLLNGLARSSDGVFIFVSHMVGESVMVFRREANSSLTRLQTIELSSVPDNLFYDPSTGDLYASCIIMLGIFHHIDDYDTKSPSQLLRIRPKGGADNPFQDYDVVEVFADDGQLLSISSSAALYGNTLLLGTVHEKAAYCEIKYVND